jgi:diamine N-acetyltransferase
MEPEDTDLLFDMENDAKDWWMGATLNPIGRATLRNFASGQHDLWRDLQLRLMIDSLEEVPRTVGALDLYQLDPRNSRAGVGIVIRESDRQQGHAQNSLRLLTQYAFEHLGLNQLWAEIPETHGASLSIFETAGFKETGTLRQWIRHQDKWVDARWVQCIRTELIPKP